MEEELAVRTGAGPGHTGHLEGLVHTEGHPMVRKQEIRECKAKETEKMVKY